MVIRLVSAILIALLVAGAAEAQDGRNIPAGSPLGPVTGTPGAAIPGAIDPAQVWLRAREAAVARAQAHARQEARAQAFAVPTRSVPAPDEEFARPRPAIDLNAPDVPRSQTGPLPTPFGSGIRPAWPANGITTPWGG